MDSPGRFKSGTSTATTTGSTSSLGAGIVTVPDWVELLAGETVAETDDKVTYLCPSDGPTLGSLCVSNYRCIFSGAGDKRIEFPLGVVHKIDKIGGQTSRGENAYGLEIHCKDFRKYRFAHPQQNHSRRSIFEKLQLFAFPVSSGNPLFAYTYHLALAPDARRTAGWALYDFEAEMRRQGVPNDAWRISNVNEGYKLSETYPAQIAVPAATVERDVEKVAAFRSKGRMPALSWLHPINRASISRSSQPRVGITEKRCKEDEELVERIMLCNPTRAKVQILDARPRANAVANKAKGLGAEPAKSYPFATLTYLNIHNIHVMRDSLKKLRDICGNVEAQRNWLASVEATNWLKHVQHVLHGSVATAKFIQNGTSVLVHCSDGWDRTAQLTATSMVLLDPFYRTIKGFEILVAKEWLSFGHKFQQRIGHGSNNHTDDQRSPIFVQFIDCIWQITQQFPSAFEFNETFLITILDEMYSCRFGTFLLNCESKRAQGEIATKTQSLWDHIAFETPKYRNPLYEPILDQLKYIPTIKCMRVWAGYYLRESGVPIVSESREGRGREIDDANAKLEAEIAALERQLAANHQTLQ